MRSAQCFVVATSLCVVVMSTTDARAQSLGAFRWQFAPYCNTVTLDVEQRGAAYVLSGYDNRCGHAVRSAASGTAHLNADGTVSMGLTIVRPDGCTASTTAIINLATLSGTWQDSFGTDGTFLFNPAAPTAVTANFILGPAFTTSCPGDIPIPRAAPVICAYTSGW